jgi:hypothetical protein
VNELTKERTRRSRAMCTTEDCGWAYPVDDQTLAYTSSTLAETLAMKHAIAHDHDVAVTHTETLTMFPSAIPRGPRE